MNGKADLQGIRAHQDIQGVSEECLPWPSSNETLRWIGCQEGLTPSDGTLFLSMINKVLCLSAATQNAVATSTHAEGISTCPTFPRTERQLTCEQLPPPARGQPLPPARVQRPLPLSARGSGCCRRFQPVSEKITAKAE